MKPKLCSRESLECRAHMYNVRCGEIASLPFLRTGVEVLLGKVLNLFDKSV